MDARLHCYRRRSCHYIGVCFKRSRNIKYAQYGIFGRLNDEFTPIETHRCGTWGGDIQYAAFIAGESDIMELHAGADKLNKDIMDTGERAVRVNAYFQPGLAQKSRATAQKARIGYGVDIKLDIGASAGRTRTRDGPVEAFATEINVAETDVAIG